MDIYKNLKAWNDYTNENGGTKLWDVLVWSFLILGSMLAWQFWGWWVSPIIVGVLFFLFLWRNERENYYLGKLIREEGEEAMLCRLMGSKDWRKELDDGTYKWKW